MTRGGKPSAEVLGPGYVAVMTAAEMAAEGFDGLEMRCRCGRTVCWPFRLLMDRLGRRRHELVALLVPRFRCEQCGRHATLAELRPWMKTDGVPDDRVTRPTLAESLARLRDGPARKGES